MLRTTSTSTSGPSTASVRLSLLDGFELSDGTAVLRIPRSAERLLAFLAVRREPQPRMTVASTLWIDTTEVRALANLRTALWKVRNCHGGILQAAGSRLGLSRQVDVDLDRVIERARRLIRTSDELVEADTDVGGLGRALLPDWDEEWIEFERERLRHLQIHALQALSVRLSALGRHGEAVDAGLAAVSAEPLRESAQRALIAAHLAEGNVCEARHQFEGYRRLLWTELGLEPSAGLCALVASSGATPHQW